MSETHFIGEFASTIDLKSRVMLPMALQKQIPARAKNRFVINRGFEKCLVVYPRNEWDIISAEVNKLNLYIKDNRDFARYFFRGATELEADKSKRILMPKSLCEYAGITKDIVLFGYANRIEVWSEKLYKKQMDEEPRDFVKLAEQVMGKLTDGK